uniref:Uncharacterized protein n=1 Tax=Plectus sambesii TaxID=2011161 RepID=A0A914W0R0_9BILA
MQNGMPLKGKQQRPTATTNIRKSGSHGNLAHRSGSASSDKAKGKHACRCHERNQLDTQLETQYLRNLQQQIYFLELENSYLKQGGKGQSTVFQPQNQPADFERKAAPNTSNTIRRLETKKTGKERAHSFHVVDREKQLIVSRLKDTEDSYVREKRLLSEEIVELQKRLDDVTPELAKKEAQIARLEDELQSAHSKLRASNSHAESLKVQLEQKDREEILLKELEDERRSEVEQLTRNIRALEMEMNDYRSKENRLQDEVTAARRQIREEELKAKKEKELGDKILQDNDSLIRENSRLSVELSRVESAQDRYRETSSTSRTSEFALSELAEVRENEMITRSDLLKAREMLRSEQMTIRQLENQVISLCFKNSLF